MNLLLCFLPFSEQRVLCNVYRRYMWKFLVRASRIAGIILMLSLFPILTIHFRESSLISQLRKRAVSPRLGDRLFLCTQCAQQGDHIVCFRCATASQAQLSRTLWSHRNTTSSLLILVARSALSSLQIPVKTRTRVHQAKASYSATYKTLVTCMETWKFQTLLSEALTNPQVIAWSLKRINTSNFLS